MILATLFIGGVTIVFPAKAEVSGTEIALGDVAKVESVDETLAASVAQFDLGYAPAPGFTRLLQRGKVERSLKSAFPDVDFKFGGESACRVYPKTATVPAAELESIARAKFTELLTGRDSELSLATPITNLLIAAGDEAFELRADWRAGEVRPGRVSMPVEILVDGAVYRTIWTSWNVDYFTSVPLLMRDVQAGEDVTPDMVKVGRLRASKVPLTGTISIAELHSAKASRALRAGTILTEHDVTRKQLILRGDTVSLEVKKGGVSARVAAIAKQAGYRGDRIQVVIIDSKREITAVIVDRDIVRLDMTPTR